MKKLLSLRFVSKVSFGIPHKLLLCYLLNGQSTGQPEQPFFFDLSPQEHDPLPLRKPMMASATNASTTNSTMTVAQFIQ